MEDLSMNSHSMDSDESYGERIDKLRKKSNYHQGYSVNPRISAASSNRTVVDGYKAYAKPTRVYELPDDFNQTQLTNDTVEPTNSTVNTSKIISDTSLITDGSVSVGVKRKHNISPSPPSRGVGSKLTRIDSLMHSLEGVTESLRLVPNPTKSVSHGTFVMYLDSEGRVNGLHASLHYINEVLARRIDELRAMTKQCIDVYSTKFRVNYSALTLGELKFVKNKTKEHSKTKFYIGIKLGLVAMMLLWIISDSYTVGSHLDIWNHPGLYVYTIVGNLLLYRVMLAVNTYMWCRFNVNYMAIFQFTYDIRPNLLLVLNHASTSLLLFMINLTLFFQLNMKSRTNYYHIQRGEVMSNACPVLLVVCVVLYELKEHYSYKHNDLKTNRGLFSLTVFYNCIFTLCNTQPVSFRESYVANMLTTFTKVYSDFMHALCWVLSGSFLEQNQTIDNFGSSYMSCSTIDWVIIICILQVIPQFFRIMQQIRQYQDTGQYTYLINVTKYLLTVVVIVYGVFQKSYTGVYLVLTVVLTVFKWFWDCYMNWGVFEILPDLRCAREVLKALCCCKASEAAIHLSLSNGGKDDNEVDVTEAVEKQQSTLSASTVGGYLFLRRHLMFSSPPLYYAIIVLNLLLRFLWVVSLLPPHSKVLGTSFLTGTKLSVFLASMEVFRRSIWGLLRVEYEHLKLAAKKTPGYLAPKKVIKYQPSRTSDDQQSVLTTDQRDSFKRGGDNLDEQSEDGEGDIEMQQLAGSQKSGDGVRQRREHSSHGRDLDLAAARVGDGDLVLEEIKDDCLSLSHTFSLSNSPHSFTRGAHSHSQRSREIIGSSGSSEASSSSSRSQRSSSGESEHHHLVEESKEVRGD
eukprot:gene26956-33608_t